MANVSNRAGSARVAREAARRSVRNCWASVLAGAPSMRMRPDHAALRVFELPRVARGAGQSQLSRRDRTVNDEADRQAFRVCWRDVMGEIAVAQQFVGGEGLIDVGAPQRLEPGIGHQARALAGRIERFAICGRPALRGVGKCAHCAGLLRPPLERPPMPKSVRRAPEPSAAQCLFRPCLVLLVGCYREIGSRKMFELEGPRDRLSVWLRRGKPDGGAGSSECKSTHGGAELSSRVLLAAPFQPTTGIDAQPITSSAASVRLATILDTGAYADCALFCACLRCYRKGLMACALSRVRPARGRSRLQ